MVRSAAFDIIGNETERAGDLRSTGTYERQAPVRPVEGERHRAKSLGIHSAKLSPLPTDARFSASPAPLRSVVRSRARVCAAHAFCELMALAGVASIDVAIALDLPQQRVSELRSGARPLEVGHILILAERLPAIREVLLRMFAERVGGQK